MPKTYNCPFWTWEEGRNMHCDAAVLRFKTAGARVAYINRYCAHVTGWEGCPMAGELCRRHERGASPCVGRVGCGTLKKED